MTRSAKLEPLPNAPVVAAGAGTALANLGVSQPEPTKADERSDRHSFFIAADVKVQSIETVDAVHGTFTTTFRATFVWPRPQRLASVGEDLDPEALRRHLEELGEWPRFDMINLVETEAGAVESTCRFRNIRLNELVVDIDGDKDDDLDPEQEFMPCIEAKLHYRHARVQTRSDALSSLLGRGVQARDEMEFGQKEHAAEGSKMNMYPFDVHRLSFGWVIRRPKLSSAEAWKVAKQARLDEASWAWYKELPDETVTTFAKAKREFGKTFEAVRPMPLGGGGRSARARVSRPLLIPSLALLPRRHSQVRTAGASSGCRIASAAQSRPKPRSR